MHPHDQIPICISHVFEADIPQDSSIVDQDIYPAVCLDCSLDDLVAILDRVVIGSRLASSGLDLVHDDIGGL